MDTNRTNIHELFLRLVRLGIGRTDKSGFKFQDSGFKSVDWVALKALADRQGLTALVLDGLNTVHGEGFMVQGSMPQMLRLEWIGEVLQNYEARYKAYEKAIGSLAGWYNAHGFKMMVLKGYACSLDWPRPEHRPCGDIDIWLFGAQKEADEVLSHTDFTDYTDKIAGQARNEGFRVQNQSRIGELENRVVIDNSHHHHTVFEWEGFVVENHYDFVNVHAHRSSREMEGIFKVLGDFKNVDDNLNDNDKTNTNGTNITNVLVNGEKVYLPSANLHALFLIRHMVSHFAAAEISLRQVLDWAFFVEKHGKEIDWKWLEGLLEKYHMRDFYNCINAICVGDLDFEFNDNDNLNVDVDEELKDRVLGDILEPEWRATEPRGFFRRMVYKYRRWQGNAWKQKMCYTESRWSAFWSGIWAKMMKPASF